VLDLARDGLRAFVVPVGDGDVSAFFGEANGDPAADP
jgi:hypothetical protein